jgi:teichuronic acid biosynthesis glycosyltransferase TuaC
VPWLGHQRRRRATGVEPSRVDVVYNGVDAKLFFPRDRAAARVRLGLPLDKKIVLYVGRLEKEKGVIDLLEAWHGVFKQTPTMNAELVLVGNGSARAEAETYQSHLNGGIRLTGARPLPEIPDWLAACDVLTLPSWNEGTPNVVLEALASGRRVVATDVGGIPDLLDPEGIGDTTLGRMVSKQQPAALAAALVRTLEEWYDPQVLASRGSHGDWAKSASALATSLQRAVAEGVR